MVGNTPATVTTTLRAFCAGESHPRAGGNPCRVSLRVKPPERSPGPSPVTQCQSWPLGEGRAGLRCWSAGGMEIDCCGHGLLCCASSWIKRWGGRDGVLVMNGSEVYCRTEGEHTWLGFEPLATQPFEIPRWCRHYFPVAPEGAAIAGTENGYLLLRWPAGFELATLPRPGAVLGRHTRRSLIVTCAVAAPPAPVSVHYRYFAPQYGVDEDAATGSAMRILANFWQHCGLGAALTAYQCSKEGGILFSRVEQGKVWVGGNVATMEEETAAVD